MPKSVKKAKRPSSDPNLRIHQMMAEMEAKQATGPEAAPEPESFQAQFKAHMAKLGAKGGKIGGKRRMRSLTDPEKSALGLKAATARWVKERAKKKRGEK